MSSDGLFRYQSRYQTEYRNLLVCEPRNDKPGDELEERDRQAIKQTILSRKKNPNPEACTSQKANDAAARIMLLSLNQ